MRADRGALIATFALLAIACGPRLPILDHPDAAASSALFAGEQDDGDLFVFDGTGRILDEVRLAPRTARRGAFEEEVLGAPELSPDGSRLAFLRETRRGTADRTSVLLGGSSRVLVVRERAGGRETRLLEDPAGDLLSPSWSRDGRRLAVVQRHDVIVLDAADGKELARVPCPTTRFCGPEGLVWDWDSGRIAVRSWCVTEPPPHGWVDPAAGVFEPVEAESLNGPLSFRGAWLERDLAKGLERPALERLFALFYGSVENPREVVLRSADRRFYAYLRSEFTTFVDRRWYEGYDPSTKRRFVILDLGRRFDIPVP